MMAQKTLTFNKIVWFSFALIALLVLPIVSGCSSQKEVQASTPTASTSGQSTTENTTESEDKWPDKLVFTPIPLEDQSVLTKRYEPFAEYLKSELGIPVEIFPATSYAAAVEAMRNGHSDLGYFGPFAYIHAASRAGAEAFAGGIKAGGEPVYYSYFITLKDSGINTLEDLKGKSFLWADPTSASGHLFPKAHLVNELGIPVDKVDGMFGEVAFSGNHEASVLAVLNGDADAAAVYDITYNMVINENKDHPNMDKLVIFEKTNPIPLPPFTVRKDLPESLKVAIKDAFYNVANVPELKAYLEDTGHAGGYVEIADDAYEVVRMTAAGLEMAPEDLVK
ncbi:phosphate/phosphite/phosphonate ABC transporter substrate-binding protein [Cohnella sp.]|uniref:phosphate/phosphite/phosphonate ABC transporter substrate-binding protein n=1 Tax=Cohnella sp. TaxID=1883426 RepID=UPI003567FA59